MIYAPINAITWTLGSLAMSTFAIKSWRSYQASANPLARIYTSITLALGIGFFFFGVPALLTENVHILKYTYFAADLFIQLSMQTMAWLLWFIGLRSVLKLRSMLIGTSLFSLALMTAQFLTSQAAVSHSPHLVVYSDQVLVLAMKSAIYVTVACPIGYFLLRQAFVQATFLTRVKSSSAGLTFLIVSLGATYNNIFDRGSDTVSSAITVGSFFAIFLIIALLPRAKPKPTAARKLDSAK